MNPTDPKLAFCGECGQPLERTWGAGFSWRPILVALAVVAVTGLFASLVLLVGKEVGSMSSILVALVLLVVGARFALSILPPGLRDFLGMVVRGVGSVLFALVFGTGNKGRA